MARILVSVGEPSGDQLAAPVVARLVAAGHRVAGVGGPACQQAGLSPVAPFEGLAAHGLAGAAASLPAFRRALRALRDRASDTDLILAVDFPELNRRLLRGAGGLTAWLAPPQAWAWRPWRADAVRQTDWVGCVLPHAAAWYRRQRVPADFVGHPLASAPPLPPGRPEVVALLPGSRPGTAARLLPLMLEAAARLRREVPSLEVVWGRSPGLAPDLPDGWPAWARVADGARAALRQAGSAWVGAGTATLDAVLAGRPCVVVARLDPAAEWLAKRLVRVPAVGLPNLVLGRRAFPECVLQDCTPAAIAAAALGLLHAPETWAPSVEAVRARLRRSDWGGEVATHLLRLLARRAPPMLRASPASPAAGARERGGSDV